MNLKKYKPVTSSQRHLILLNKKNLNKFSLLKTQIKGKINSAGKNHKGQITSYHKGGGHKKSYRKINFNRSSESTAIVTSIEYDPNRTANIAAIYNFINNSYNYIISPLYLKVGDIVKSGLNAEIKLGHSLPLYKIPVGSFICCVSPQTTKIAQITRSAGTYSILIEKARNFCKIKLSSGEIRYVPAKSFATVGIVSNPNNFLKILAKAGRSRWLNKRPKVRGVAMNPIDHPHGGGEGKTSGGRTSVTPWGKPTKNKKTSNSKNKLVIVARKAKK